MQIGRLAPACSPVRRDVQRQLEAAPDAQFVKGVAQVVLDDLLSGADDISDLAVGLAFPYQSRHLNFFWSKPVTWLHGIPSALFGIRRSQALPVCGHRVMPARRNSVRRCC